MKDFPKYLEARAARLKNLYVFLNTEATVEKVKQFKPDIVVNATGSVPLVPPIKGLKENIEAGNVATIFDMINNLNAGKYPDEACQGKKVVVVGGGSVGLDVIEYFAPRGAECTIIDMLPQIGMLADPITKCSMRETHDKYGVKGICKHSTSGSKRKCIHSKTSGWSDQGYGIRSWLQLPWNAF